MQTVLTHETHEQGALSLTSLVTESRRLRIVVVAFVLVPILLLSTIGVLVLILGDRRHDYVVGGAILSLVAMTLCGLRVAASSVLRQVACSRIQWDWVSRLSHDLRTPLSSIRLFIETLQLGRVAEPRMRQHCLNILSRECARLSALVDQILGWARLDAGKRTYSREFCRAAEIIEEALSAFELQRIVEHVRVNRDVRDTCASVYVDRSTLVQALLNLLQNACKHSGDSKQITVGCRVVPHTPDVMFFVNDNGPGIDKREHGRIFEKFYRSKDALQRKLCGSGLGLAITQQIVRDQGGTVSVESELGRGSSFRIVLRAYTREER